MQRVCNSVHISTYTHCRPYAALPAHMSQTLYQSDRRIKGHIKAFKTIFSPVCWSLTFGKWIYRVVKTYIYTKNYALLCPARLLDTYKYLFQSCCSAVRFATSSLHSWQFPWRRGSLHYSAVERLEDVSPRSMLCPQSTPSVESSLLPWKRGNFALSQYLVDQFQLCRGSSAITRFGFLIKSQP